jgi:hypothetical protein
MEESTSLVKQFKKCACIAIPSEFLETEVAICHGSILPGSFIFGIL